MGCVAVLVSLVAGASPALASQQTVTGKDSAGDGLAGSNRDIVSTSFDYDDSGTLELKVTMAAPIDPQNARLETTWTVTEANADDECSIAEQSASQFTIQYDTAGTGHMIYGPPPAPPRPLGGAARIDGATLVYDVSDPQLAGHKYSCLYTGVSSVRGDSDNTSADPADRAAAAATGFTAPGPFVDVREEGKSVEATDSGVVRLTFNSSAYDKAEGAVTLKTAHKVRAKRSAPLRVLKLGAADVALDQDGGKTTGKVKLTKAGLAFLNKAGRVAVIATIVAKDAQGRKSTTEVRFTLESPPE